VVVGGESDLGNQLDGTEAELVGNAGIPKSPRIDLATSDESAGPCLVGNVGIPKSPRIDLATSDESAGPCPIGLMGSFLTIPSRGSVGLL
jgi:hypothetical protein